MNPMQQLQQMQERLAEVERMLDVRTVTEESGGGAVRVTITGSLRVTAVTITPEALKDADPEMIEDLVITAMNKAITAARETAAAAMAEATKGMLPNIPGMNLPF